MDEKNKYDDVDSILEGIFSKSAKSSLYPLHELFERRLIYLDITKSQALTILDIDHKTLKTILTGESKKINFIAILKFSDFLDIPHNQIIEKYFDLVRDTHKDQLLISKKRNFIINHFNLSSLKKIGLIESIRDFEHIESQINTFMGYESIFEHERHRINAAFSSGKRSSNLENLNFWYAASCQSLDKTPNPNEFDRQGLIDFFPEIRWHSMNVRKGLMMVAQKLFDLGVTVIVVPKFTTDLHIRGATLAYKGKPCIVLTKYTPYYASIWFALIHELFHVLYDWEEIRTSQYHLSNEIDSVNISEVKANNFARQYLCSDEKMNQVVARIDEPRYVESFADSNHIHSSIIYSFYCFDNGSPEAYKKYTKFNPTDEYDELLDHYELNEFIKLKPISDISKERNSTIYNSF